MTQEVVTSASETPPTAQRSSKVAKSYPKQWLFTAIARSFLAGMHFAWGLDHSRGAGHEYDDFFFSAGWLTMAIGAGVRLLKATRPSLN